MKPPRKKKKKGSLGESFAVLKSSPKILSLAMLVMSYGVSHRLFEFAWKGQLRVLFPSAQAYQVTAMPMHVWGNITGCKVTRGGGARQGNGRGSPYG